VATPRFLNDEKKNKPTRHFSEREICKFFICGFCPHDLFVNLKCDLGECKKVHDDDIRKQWEEYPDKERYGFEEEFIRYCEKLTLELDRKMKKSQSSLNRRKLDGSHANDNIYLRIEQIDKRYDELFKTMEKYSEEARVDEVNEIMTQLEELKKEKKTLTDQVQVTQDKRMELCKICGAYLVIGDTEKRKLSHLEGKQHKGYELIRNKIDEYYVLNYNTIIC